MELKDIIENCPSNYEINKAWLVTDNKLKQFDHVVCSISGGSDSDIVLHLVATLDKEKKATYVFFDTGLEFQATKEHIKQLQEKYGIEIITKKAIKPIPSCVKQYGIPFLSKRVSDYIYRLQKHNFKFEDRPFQELIKEYPKCRAALRWWCNEFGENSKFNCCEWAKKNVINRFIEENGFDLNIVGIRKAEGGARQTAYKNCFSEASEKHIAQYRPIFWFKNNDKEQFNNHYEICNSDCYTVWGLPRTGCSGCPYALDIEHELEAVRQHEPKLYKALLNVFGESYEYTRKYREFCNIMNKKQEESAMK